MGGHVTPAAWSEQQRNALSRASPWWFFSQCRAGDESPLSRAFPGANVHLETRKGPHVDFTAWLVSCSSQATGSDQGGPIGAPGNRFHSLRASGWKRENPRLADRGSSLNHPVLRLGKFGSALLDARTGCISGADFASLYLA